MSAAQGLGTVGLYLVFGRSGGAGVSPDSFSPSSTSCTRDEGFPL